MNDKPARTLNPLHFEDLEPHRFEDMIRQLAYDFRTWRLIEPTGRLGADDGIDIRAIETVGREEGLTGDSEDEVVVAWEPVEERVWVIQCKREKEIGPTKARRIARGGMPSGGDKIYGFILAAACDFSKRTRDAFHQEARQRGVRESYLWGKADLEDMLFLPKYDHLLFAYFNISLQVRRRSLQSQVRSRLTMKRKLVSVLGDIQNRDPKWVFLRDPREERYPYEKDIPDLPKGRAGSITLSWLTVSLTI
ncbi:MAG TPA: hypothetical protein DDY78_07210 [Planctomycetales bacterium]|jgi:hypothetical protein|nr:hypothetical protein [Planctomycetales bacterium]